MSTDGIGSRPHEEGAGTRESSAVDRVERPSAARPAFAQLLRRHRLRARLTQEELAARAALSVRGLSDLERGVRAHPYPHTVRRLIEALGLDETDAAAFAAAAQRKDKPSMTDPVPVPPTPLIGREAEVAAVCRLLRRGDPRLVTLTGTAGVGKTRLALEVASALGDDFADGVIFVSLASIRDPALVIAAIAQALGVQQSAQRSLHDGVRVALHGREMLLVLDNFEHVLSATPLVADLLATCPRSSVLVTSRGALHVRGEQEFPVAPLALPVSRNGAGLASVAASPAVELFVARARAVSPRFRLTAENASAVVGICRRLDGLPLAIELAAARARVLPPATLLARLEQRLPLLTGGPRDVDVRHRTLRDAIAWSYNLLGTEEQRLFRRLTVFAGGCTLEAAEAVCGTDPGDATAVLDTLESLVDKHLVRIEERPEAQRVLMLETIREYAWERLVAAGEAEVTERAHAAYYLAFAERAETEFRGVEQATWLARLETEHDNMRAALAWSAADPERAETGARLAGALAIFWCLRGHVSEGRRWLEGALAQSASPPGHAPAVGSWTRANLLYGAAQVALAQGDHVAARPWLEESVALFRKLGDGRQLGKALWVLGLVLTGQGDPAAARPIYEESVALFWEAGDVGRQATALVCLGHATMMAGNPSAARAMYKEGLALFEGLGDVWGRATALNALGNIAWSRGESAAARSLYEESVALIRRSGDKWSLAATLINLAFFGALRQGDSAKAGRLFAESLALWRDVGDRSGIALSLAGLAGVAAVKGQAERAGRLFGASDALLAATSKLVDPMFPVATILQDGSARSAFDRSVAEARAHLDAAAFEAGWAQGHALSPEQAVDEALADGEPSLP